MTATDQNIVIWQGEDKPITVDLEDGDGAPYGSTDGLTFSWRVSPSKDDRTSLIAKSTGSGITNGTSLITIDLNSADSENLRPVDYYHECRVVDSSGEENVVFVGAFKVKPSTTKTV